MGGASGAPISQSVWREDAASEVRDSYSAPLSFYSPGTFFASGTEVLLTPPCGPRRCCCESP